MLGYQVLQTGKSTHADLLILSGLDRRAELLEGNNRHLGNRGNQSAAVKWSITTGGVLVPELLLDDAVLREESLLQIW